MRSFITGALHQEMRNAYRILIGKPYGMGPLRRPRHRWGDNVRLNRRETGWDVMEWMYLAQDTDQWCAVVNTVINFRVP
jgi:hypothetical protein